MMTTYILKKKRNLIGSHSIIHAPTNLYLCSHSQGPTVLNSNTLYELQQSLLDLLPRCDPEDIKEVLETLAPQKIVIPLQKIKDTHPEMSGCSISDIVMFVSDCMKHEYEGSCFLEASGIKDYEARSVFDFGRHLPEILQATTTICHEEDITKVTVNKEGKLPIKGGYLPFFLWDDNFPLVGINLVMMWERSLVLPPVIDSSYQESSGTVFIDIVAPPSGIDDATLCQQLVDVIFAATGVTITTRERVLQYNVKMPAAAKEDAGILLGITSRWNKRIEVTEWDLNAAFHGLITMGGRQMPTHIMLDQPDNPVMVKTGIKYFEGRSEVGFIEGDTNNTTTHHTLTTMFQENTLALSLQGYTEHVADVACLAATTPTLNALLLIVDNTLKKARKWKVNGKNSDPPNLINMKGSNAVWLKKPRNQRWKSRPKLSRADTNQDTPDTDPPSGGMQP